MSLTVRVADAHKKLVELVTGGIEFPDAEDRVQTEFNLTVAQAKEVRRLYDEPCDAKRLLGRFKK